MSTFLAAFVLLASPPGPSRTHAPIPYDDVVRRPGHPTPTGIPRRKLGAPTTLFVNFDGVTIGDCYPADSHRNCHWINTGKTFEPWSGSDQARWQVLQAMRSMVRPYGIRVTGQRPRDDEQYTMVVYGGTEEEFGSLGLAPAGDCWDEYPDEFAFAYMDGDKVGWVNGGAATAVHEAAHTWGLDHIDEPYAIMAPAGDNSRTYFRTDCVQIVQDADYTPGGESCPPLNRELCDADDQQNDQALLLYLFGETYVDRERPRMQLRSPEDGQYFQGPADLMVEIDVFDDLHPQLYERWIWIEGLIEEPSMSQAVLDADFEVRGLPVGDWTVHVRLADEAGNEASLSFEIEVGEDPPPADDAAGCGCRTGRRGVSDLGFALWITPVLAIRRRRG